MKGINDMTKDNKVAKLNFKRATKDEKKSLLNYGIFNETIKEYDKQNKLIKPTHIELFKRLKTNLIILNNMDNGYEGFAQYIRRNLQRFDVSKFKEENPKLYTQYLVPMETNEIKVKYNLIGSANNE
jgi:hypothetical protein